jgi:acetyl esterase/lipase
MLLRNTLKKQRLSIPEHRASGNRSAKLLGGVPAGMQLEPATIQDVYAEWISPAEASPGQVILYLHGGGYVSGSIDAYRRLGGLLADCSGSQVLLPAYRLAPEYPFPAALDDVLKVYRWLLANGHPPAEIIIAGDSAGGGLALAAALTLRDQCESLPAGVICLSPWTDLTLNGQSHIAKAKSEAVLNTEVLREWALSYTSADNLRNPLVSPVNADFQGFPPLFIQVGSEEILLDDAILLAEKARAAGAQVELNIWAGMWHGWQVLGDLIPENRRTYDEIGRFARRILKAGSGAGQA